MKTTNQSISNATIRVILPVLFSYFVMGFCDAVGIASNYVKQDFGLSETQANLLPSMVFLWFFFFSVPVGILMNRIGRKKTVLISLAFTFMAMIIPYFVYNFPMILFAFALLGVGNTILQVSLNPLLTNVVSPRLLTSSLTAGQFVKAICSFCAPIIAAFTALHYGNWQLMFPIFALITLITGLWLLATPIQKKSDEDHESVSLLTTFLLLKNRSLFLLFLGIVFVVGVDVGINVVAPKLLMEKCGLPLSEAGYGTSIYFVFKTIGAFVGAFLLAKVSSLKFFRISILIAFFALVTLSFANSEWLILMCISIIGFSCANIFSIIFGIALQEMPQKANEISGLMIMGVSGGAVIPLIMGYFTEQFASTLGALMVIGFCIVYLVYSAFSLKENADNL